MEITIREFLGIPKDSRGVIVKQNFRMLDKEEVGTVEVKFDCKSEPVLLQYPFESHYKVIK